MRALITRTAPATAKMGHTIAAATPTNLMGRIIPTNIDNKVTTGGETIDKAIVGIMTTMITMKDPMINIALGRIHMAVITAVKNSAQTRLLYLKYLVHVC